mmetsp:Transcript_8910/g.13110  ORF Transcript_8910/g.13110 Transcript_8910/m.13110 type:complete len:1433 (-) Transcript_8910:115-4413(-)
MMAAAAAAAAAEAAARDAAEAAVQADLMGREASMSAAVSAMVQGDGMMGVEFQGNGGAAVDEEALQRQLQQEQLQLQLQQQAYDMAHEQMGMDGGASMEEILQQMVAEQQYQQQQLELQQELAAQAAMEAHLNSRPHEHFLTVAQNGTILGATETITGFPPSNLLMTSAYDSIHEEDLLGLHAIKTYFWEKGRPEVEAYLRRRTLEGDWVWLVAKVVSFIDNPVPGLIIHEIRAEDEEVAETVCRTTRITALLMQAVESANYGGYESEGNENAGAGDSDPMSDVIAQVIPGVADDAAALQALLASAAGGGIDLSDSANPLQQLMEAAASGGAITNDNAANVGNAGGNNGDRNNYDPLSAIDCVRSGPSIDMSKVVLSPPELKMVTLVLTGRLRIEDLGPLVLSAMETSGMGLVGALDGYVTDREGQHLHRSGRRKSSANHSGRIPNSDRGGSDREHLPYGDERRVIHGWSNNMQNMQQMQMDVLGYSSGIYQQDQSNPPLSAAKSQSPMPSLEPLCPPPLSVLNFSFTSIGNEGLDMLSEVLYVDNTSLKTIDLGFCGVDERGILALCRALRKRRKRGLPSLQALVLSGNVISYKAGKELGLALSDAPEKKKRTLRKRSQISDGTGYDEDDEFDDDDEELDDDDALFGGGYSRNKAKGINTGGREDMASSKQMPKAQTNTDSNSEKEIGKGIQLLHLGCSSISIEALYQLLIGLGQDCPLRELRIPSNNLGPSGATMLVSFLEGKGISKHKKGKPVMPYLDRLDMSHNDLGNDGTAKLTRAISKRAKVNIVDLRLSSNNIGAGGIETIMNKLLQHNLVSLSLDNNTIGDRGCQLVAASLPSMHHLHKLNLSFNQIGSRGITTLMRSLVGCESITALGLSGNIMKISGAIAMGFALAQHPRLAELDLDNCCLSQVAQCHIVAGIISNRWVPMRKMNGFRAGPPMVAIGALEVLAQHLNNEECFRIRRDIQMKTILQWMESNRAAKAAAANNMGVGGDGNFITSDYVSNMNDVNGAPSQSAYLRMLDWLSRIPFDEDELTDLRRYFYDVDGGEGGDGMRGSDGNINLKHRGDLLAALGSEIVDVIRDATPEGEGQDKSCFGLDIEGHNESDEDELLQVWSSMDNFANKSGGLTPNKGSDSGKKRKSVGSAIDMQDIANNSDNLGSKDLKFGNLPNQTSMRSIGGRSSVSSLSKQSMLSRTESERSTNSHSERSTSGTALKARITMFPQFAAKLDTLKASAQEMMDHEEDPVQQDIIAQQFAEASLTLLRQLRYHCMNSGLDGWRQGNFRRKVLIVDDSKVTRKMVSRAFEKANFIVDTAENGMEGVAKMKEFIYDIAFMDIDMPVMNGFDATKALRDWEDAKRPGARQPICALTAAYVDDFERSELMKFKEAGLDVMESKPCNIPRLFKVVDDVSPMFSDLSISVTQLDPISGQ